MDRKVNKQKLKRQPEQFKLLFLTLISHPRPSKKCFVRDIDYTLFDHRSIAENPYELMRPNLHDFLTTAYQFYVIIIGQQPEYHGVFDCKPLGVIWLMCPEFYNPKNTIIFDDLRRNVVINPRNGLVINSFRKAHINRATDQELLG